jgi:hypothetical protein
LCADKKHIRAQSTIWYKKQPQRHMVLIHNRVFDTDALYPYQKRGWRAARATAARRRCVNNVRTAFCEFAIL